MSFQTYLDALKETQPFKLKFQNVEYEIPNFNSMTWEELNWILICLKTNSFEFYNNYLPIELTNKLSQKQKAALFEELEKHAGIMFSEYNNFVYIVNEWSRELEYDLRKLVHIEGILGLLNMKIVEALDIFMMVVNDSESWTRTRVLNWKYPFTLEHAMLADLVTTLVHVNSAKGNNFQYSRLPESDTNNSILEESDYNVDEQAQEAQIEKLKARQREIHGN